VYSIDIAKYMATNGREGMMTGDETDARVIAGIRSSRSSDKFQPNTGVLQLKQSLVAHQVSPDAGVAIKTVQHALIETGGMMLVCAGCCSIG